MIARVILVNGPPASGKSTRSRRQALSARGENHPERDIGDADVEPFIRDAVDRLTRLPTVRAGAQVVSVGVEASEDDVYRRRGAGGGDVLDGRGLSAQGSVRRSRTYRAS